MHLTYALWYCSATVLCFLLYLSNKKILAIIVLCYAFKYIDNMENYWHAFDLHMHTLPGITGDGKKENDNAIANFSYCNFIHSLCDVRISLFAITNHNFIHLEDFLVCRYLAKRKGINSLLGTELDIEDKCGSNYHMACIFDCDLIQSIALRDYVNDKALLAFNRKEKVRFDSEDIVYLLSKFRAVVIPHCPRKEPGIPLNSQDDAIELMKKVKEGYICVLDEKSQWDLAYLKKNLLDEIGFYKYAKDIGAIFLSDNKDWGEGEYKKRLKHVTCMNSEPTFKGLIHCLTNPTERFTFREFVPSYSNYVSKIKITNKSNESLLSTSTILLQPGFNCVIGRSGSGKSLIVHLLMKYLINESTSLYSKYDNDGAEIELFDEHGDTIDAKRINVAVGTSVFNKLIEAIDAEDSNSLTKIIQRLDQNYIKFENFYNYKREYGARVQLYFDKKEKFKKDHETMVSELIRFSSNYKVLCSYSGLNTIRVNSLPSKITFSLTDDEMIFLDKYKTNFSELRSILSLIEKAGVTNDLKKGLNNLEHEFKKAIAQVQKAKKCFEYKMKKIEIVGASVEAVNRNVSMNAGQKSILEAYFRDNIGVLADNIVEHYKLRNLIKDMDLSVNLTSMETSRSINRDGSISFTEKIDADLFKKATFKDRIIYNTFGLSINNDKIYDLTSKKDAKLFFETIYYSSRFEYRTDIASQKILNNITPSLTLLFNNQDVKSLNSGDIAKTYLKDYFNHQLGDGNSIVIYDQLENDVDKEFIKTELLSYISDLKKRIQLIVVTHDPIIAVNGDPVNYVIAEKDNAKRIAYRSFVPESEERDELETLANTVDGSKEVIRERYRVYKGENL